MMTNLNKIPSADDGGLLWTIFFSQENIQKLQDAIGAGMYHKSNNGECTISLPDCDNLKTAMRSIFLQHSSNTNRTTNIKFQVNELNKLVLKWFGIYL